MDKLETRVRRAYGRAFLSPSTPAAEAIILEFVKKELADQIANANVMHALRKAEAVAAAYSDVHRTLLMNSSADEFDEVSDFQQRMRDLATLFEEKGKEILRDCTRTPATSGTTAAPKPMDSGGLRPSA